MTSRGSNETLKLKSNIQDQMHRLLTQLQDLDEMKDDLEEDEYNESRADTLQQMQEFEQSLNKMLAGDMTLVDEIGHVQLAIQSAIRQAFKSPEVMKMFAKKENGALRSRLAQLDADLKLGKITSAVHESQVVEILQALEKLNEPLSDRERELLTRVRQLSIFSTDL